MPKESRSEPEQAPVDLSEAARAVVRDPGDPRIDAHLAALGLGQADAPTSGARGRGDATATEVPELRERIAELEGQLHAARARVRSLGLLVAAAAVVILSLLAVLVLR